MKSRTKSPAAGATVAAVLHDAPAKNLQVVKLSDGRIAYVYDPAQQVGPSKSGKSVLVSTTGGALRIEGLPNIAVNIYQ
jgi:hypothetical protein